MDFGRCETCLNVWVTLVSSLLVDVGVGTGSVQAETTDRVHVSDDGSGFVFARSGRRFVPWGFNYDHDGRGRLIEDYWETEWPTVEQDFREMKQLGANIVRVHVQLGKFMRSEEQPDEKALQQLGRLVGLTERVGLYLDVTGLGCYHKPDVPDWYDALDERARWEVQARFWDAVAQQCARSPAIFCYDLMNEPVVAGGKKKRTDWLGPAFAGKHFVQFITLSGGGRDRTDVARRWIRRLTTAIRKHDREHLITVGLVPWSLDRPGMQSGFVPEKIVGDLDFISVHIYPEKSKLRETMETLAGFSVGKPVVIEETFPLKCPPAEFEQFMHASREVASGWIGFYWGKTIEEYHGASRIADALTLAWLDFFVREGKRFGG